MPTIPTSEPRLQTISDSDSDTRSNLNKVNVNYMYLSDDIDFFIKNLPPLKNSFALNDKKKKLPHPYLDIFTIQSKTLLSTHRKTIKASSSDHVDKHSMNLLVEPIQIPNLSHTGVLVQQYNKHSTKSLHKESKSSSSLMQETEEKHLFYSNGSRNINLRDILQQSIEQDSNIPPTEDQSPSKMKKTPKKAPKKNKPQQQQTAFTMKVSESKSSLHHAETDKQTKEILSALKANMNKMNDLINNS